MNGYELKSKHRSDCVKSDWHRKKIKDIGSVVTGKTPPTNETKYWNGGIFPFITPSEIPDFNSRFLQSVERKVSDVWKSKSRQYLLPKETICFVCIGSTIGKMCLTNEDSFTNQQINAIIPKSEVNPLFIFYALRNDAKDITRVYGGGGAAKSIINKSTFENIEVSLPICKLEQTAIAKILSDLDSKIELNQKMNKTLEAIAQAIFKHWFIDFEFPNENGKPYKSSGGEMVDSELGEIPKGWNIRILGDLGKIVCGKTPSTKDETNFGQDVPFITIPDMRENVFTFKTERYLSTKGANSQETKFLPPLAVCVSCIATPGLVTLTSTTSQTNQQINSIICKDGVSPFYVYFVSKEKSQEIINKGLGGTATLNLNTSEFSNLKVILPDPVTLRNFHDFTTQFFKKILNNSKEILVLTYIRDSLLPRLMTGKIRVPLED